VFIFFGSNTLIGAGKRSVLIMAFPISELATTFSDLLNKGKKGLMITYKTEYQVVLDFTPFSGIIIPGLKAYASLKP
jgi:hypothetical protein